MIHRLALLAILLVGCGMPAVTDDASADATPDSAPGDAMVQPDATPDTATMPDVQTADVQTDAGATTFDLNAPRTALEVRVLYGATCDGCMLTVVERVSAIGMPSCTVMNNTLRFFVPTLYDLVGTLSTTGGSGTLQVASRLLNVPAQAMAIVRSGTVSGGRQSFHVQVSAPATDASDRITGVPGRTTSPMHGDLWLLGCQVVN